MWIAQTFTISIYVLIATCDQGANFSAGLFGMNRSLISVSQSYREQ